MPCGSDVIFQLAEQLESDPNFFQLAEHGGSARVANVAACGGERRTSPPWLASSRVLKGEQQTRGWQAQRDFKHAQCAACRKVCTTGRRSTSRSPHHPAPQASNAPAPMPTRGTQGEACQLNSNT